MQKTRGELTLGERSEYLSDPWRFQDRNQVSVLFPILDEETTEIELSTLVVMCPENGLGNEHYQTENRIREKFSRQATSVKWDYCEGFVSVMLQTYRPRSSHYPSIFIHEQAYSHLSETGALEAFINQMKMDKLRDSDLRRFAEEHVQQLPASGFLLAGSEFENLTGISLGTQELRVKNRIEQIYLQSKCQ
jgi:hypothetical protein